jgi:hypothetical protein
MTYLSITLATTVPLKTKHPITLFYRIFISTTTGESKMQMKKHAVLSCDTREEKRDMQSMHPYIKLVSRCRIFRLDAQDYSLSRNQYVNALSYLLHLPRI